MGLFKSLFEKKSGEPGELMFKLTRDLAISVIHNSINNCKKGAEFEIILFNAGILLQHANNIKPHKINQIQDDYFKVLLEYVKQNNFHNLIQQDIGDFINNRLVLYNEELLRFSNGGGMAIPTKLMYNFIENPLQPNSGDNFDLSSQLLIMATLMPGLKRIEEGANIIIPKFY